MESAGADWLDVLLLPLVLLLHAARKQTAASKRNVKISLLATTANLRPKNVNVIRGIAVKPGYRGCTAARFSVEKLHASSSQINSLDRSDLQGCIS
jgi:hypothetical protein